MNPQAHHLNAKSHLHYTIHGNDMQVVEVELLPEETVIAEVGSLNYMDEGIRFESKLSDGSDQSNGVIAKVVSICKRMLSGEKAYVTHFTNISSRKARVGFSAPHPGNIVPINLTANNGVIYATKESFLAASQGTHISVTLTKKIGAGLFAGDGFVLQKLTGNNMAFLCAGGTVIQHTMLDETLHIEPGSLVAFSQNLVYSVEMLNPKNAMFGGKGLFMVTLKGTGTVWTQSMPFSRLVERIFNAMPISVERIDKLEKKVEKLKKANGKSGFFGMS
jgi:uncharacterized protein (TIGR00266 family)